MTEHAEAPSDRFPNYLLARQIEESRANVARTLAGALVMLALGAVAAGLWFGLFDVKAGVGASCGSAFSPVDTSSSFDLTDSGKDTCAREVRRAESLAFGSLIAGAVVLAGALVILGSEGRAVKIPER